MTDDALHEQCLAVRETAESYADRFGEYPGSVDIGREIEIVSCEVTGCSDGRLPEGPITEWPPIPRGTDSIFPPDAIVYTVIRFEGWNLGYIVVGYGTDGPAVEFTSDETRAETIVRLNCLYLRAAVEEFAIMNGGEYPEDTDTDRTPCGSTVMDLLPRGHLCRNPYTGKASVPVHHTPIEPGAIGYTAVSENYRYEGTLVSDRLIWYIISGEGDGVNVCAINNLGYSSNEALTVQNCLTVERAVLRFTRNNDGYFPCSTADCDIFGNTLVDHLPGGRLLRNPCTGFSTEPIDGAACVASQTGYIVVAPWGEPFGCHITGTDSQGSEICHLYSGPPEAEGHEVDLY